MQKNIAFFDFDGTITRSDTMLELIKFNKGIVAYCFGIFILTPWLFAMKCKLISTQKGKEKLLNYFFGNYTLEDFNKLCLNFSNKILPTLIRKDAWSCIKEHHEAKTIVVVVSASAENWVAPWCIKNNIQFVCSKLKVENNKISGCLEGLNCNGQEKINRILSLYNPSDFDNIYCYGDSNGDKQMLEIATQPFLKIFKQ